LGSALGGIAYLCPIYGVAATAPGQRGYQSVLSQLIAAITGRRAFYWTSIVSILIVLSLSANTAFADFPRLSRAIAGNQFLPHSLTLRGRRLVFTPGVYALAVLTGVLLIIFRGVTDRLIPWYAVGAFLAFTLSQAGMVAHWKRKGGRRARNSMAINAVGAIATGITVTVVLITKFREGAWITVLLIPALILMMYLIHHHYQRVERATALDTPVNTTEICEPVVLIPIERWSAVSEKTLRFAWSISKQITFVHVDCGEEQDTFRQRWSELVEVPARNAQPPVPKLVVLESPFGLLSSLLWNIRCRYRPRTPTTIFQFLFRNSLSITGITSCFTTIALSCSRPISISKKTPGSPSSIFPGICIFPSIPEEDTWS